MNTIVFCGHCHQPIKQGTIPGRPKSWTSSSTGPWCGGKAHSPEAAPRSRWAG